MTDSVKEAVRQYQEQLLQVQEALKNASEEDRDNLLSLQSDLRELIELTGENCSDEDNGCGSSEQTSQKEESRDQLDDEYNLFKAELAELGESPSEENSQTNEQPQNSSLEDELKALEGTKCRAPHGSSWGGTGYHNAMVCSVYKNDDELSSLSDIMVRVFFINPTHKEMLPCPFFLDGSCKFSEDQCHFSHGAVVPFTSIQEYREPDFSTIRMGSRVLAKQKNKLWHRSVILRVPDEKHEKYQVRFESNGHTTDVGIDDLLPLDDDSLNMSDSSDDSDYEQEIMKCRNEDVVQKSLLAVNPSQRLGVWEEHTRGIGSKLMAQMGYITGTGLGKRSDGRVDPVEATVLPAGKSLDHCMTLRENAGGDENLFSVERRMQRQKKKLEQQRQKEYLREKRKEKNNVFHFMNSTFGDRPQESKPSSSKTHKDLKKESSKTLNVASYQIGENITKLQRESTKLRNSLSRFSEGSVQHNNIVFRINEAQKEITKLRSTEKRIATEQSQRKFQAKF